MRRLLKRERGQSALLAVVGLIILAIGMYTSYNLSRTVYEKIQLQNAADATAYSIATMEARTFNFIAFANRAQAANYVQMMEAQSLLSNATYLEGVAGYTGDLFQSFGRFLRAAAKVWSYLKPLADMLMAAGRTAETAHGAMEPAVSAMETWSTKFVQLQTTKNHALFAVSAMIALSTALQVATGGEEIAQMNDPNARYTWASWLLSGLNTASYASAFDAASFGMSGDEEQRQARRAMTEIVHGSRYSTPKLGQDYVVAREALDHMGHLVSAITDVVNAPTKKKGRRYREMARKVLDAMMGEFVGTTKLLETGDSSRLPDLGDTKLADPHRSDLAEGEWLTAKDHGKLLMFGRLSKIGFASVTSGVDEFRHCRYSKPDSKYGAKNMNPLSALSRALSLYHIREQTADRYGFEQCYSGASHDTDHRWRSAVPGLLAGGMASYLKFAPQRDGISAERTGFNQPDVWMMFNKRPSDMALGGSGDLDFEIERVGGPTQRAGLDARIGEDVRGNIGEAFFPDGINVMARAQVYYHRPGAWQEPPNFFNPYWGARLAPKNVAIKRLASELGLGDSAAQLIADNVWMH
jgi:hypothetical protein